MDVFRTIAKLDMSTDWDPGKDESKFMKKFGVNSFGLYTRTKAVMVVAGRDFVLNFMFNKEQDGTIIVLCLDTKDKEMLEMCPPRKGVTRGGLPISGWIIKPDHQDPENKCHVHLIIELDFGGFMPDFVMKIAFQENGMLIDNLRKSVKKFREKFKSKYVQ